MNHSVLIVLLVLVKDVASLSGEVRLWSRKKALSKAQFGFFWPPISGFKHFDCVETE